MTRLRDADLDDAPSLGRLHARTWREAYWGVLPDPAIDRETPEGRERFWRAHLERLRSDDEFLDENVVIAEGEDGTPVGFVWVGGPRVIQAAWDGEIYMLYVLQSAHRGGVGRLLMGGAAQSLARRGLFRVGLWVLADNGPARAFYEALGGRPAGDRRERVGGGAQAVVGYVWDDASALFTDAPAAR
ncbi:MAG: GNAT family N-acetyltransferase [Caulobacterales bacterium]|nr:GNAT family N-acetyltransferase [Caulobacterales bacterium]